MKALRGFLKGMAIALILTFPGVSMVYPEAASLTTSINVTVLPIAPRNIVAEKEIEKAPAYKEYKKIQKDFREIAIPKVEKIIRGNEELTIYTICGSL